MSVKYRSAHAPTGLENFYGKIAPIITGVGASVVILGALFKIMHWPGAAPMLIVGLGTEAVLFLLFAFAPPVTEADWTIIHPELADSKGNHAKPVKKEGQAGGAVKKLDEVISNALAPDVLDKIGAGFKQLNQSVNDLGKLTNAAVASEEYSTSVQAASATMKELNKSYSSTVIAMSDMASTSKDAKEYHSQVQGITKNLSALNAVYELELQDVNVHLKSMNKFYGSLTSAMDNMTEASKEATTFKSELSKLTGNLNSLNNVYGNMLAAMKA